jgi:hypothetical protein
MYFTRLDVPLGKALGLHSNYVSQQELRDVQKLSAWLRESAYRDDWIMMTRMKWESGYGCVHT